MKVNFLKIVRLRVLVVFPVVSTVWRISHKLRCTDLLQMSINQIIVHIDTIAEEELNSKAWLTKPGPDGTSLDGECSHHLIDVVVVGKLLVLASIKVLGV